QRSPFSAFFFFNDTATTEIYTLSLHDALPISPPRRSAPASPRPRPGCGGPRSEEHTSELQSRRDLVCRLLLEKKKTIQALDEGWNEIEKTAPERNGLSAI